MRVLILGVNGFIGNALTERILTTTDWEVFGLDMSDEKIEPFLANPRFRSRPHRQTHAKSRSLYGRANARCRD